MKKEKGKNPKGEENALRASLFTGSKFTLNKTLTTWPKFLLFNPRCFVSFTHTREMISSRARFVLGSLIVGSFRSFSWGAFLFLLINHPFPPRTHSNFDFAAAGEIAVKFYWLINQYLKVISTFAFFSISPSSESSFPSPVDVLASVSVQSKYL